MDFLSVWSCRIIPNRSALTVSPFTVWKTITQHWHMNSMSNCVQAWDYSDDVLPLMWILINKMIILWVFIPQKESLLYACRQCCLTAVLQDIRSSVSDPLIPAQHTTTTSVSPLGMIHHPNNTYSVGVLTIEEQDKRGIMKYAKKEMDCSLWL